MKGFSWVIQTVSLLSVFLYFNSEEVVGYISRCTFYDKRNKEVKQTFYIPTKDVNMYKTAIEKLLVREFNELNDTPVNGNINSGGTCPYSSSSSSSNIESAEEKEVQNKNEEKKPKVTNMEEIRKKEEMKKKKKEMKEKLVYIEKYKQYIKNILKNIEFKCENIKDYNTTVKCNLCIYTEVVNDKHIRQGQAIQIFMNECIYGFYYFDNIEQYYNQQEENNSKLVSTKSTNNLIEKNNINKENSNKDKKNIKIDDVYMSITKDVMTGNTNHINFFRKENSVYHPVCYVSD